MSSAFQVVRSDAPSVLPAHLCLDAAFVAFQQDAQQKRVVTFCALGANGVPVASLTLAGREDGPWTSPITGVFGGVAAVRRAPAAAVFEIAGEATRWLREEAKRSGIVRLPPDAFADPGSAALENALFRSGWRLDQTDLNYHLPITTPEAFLKGLGETKQKEIRRLQRSGAAFRRLPPAEGLRAYQVIAENRAARGYPMTMTWPQVAELGGALPGQVSFWVAERGGDVLAGAVCLQLTETYAYVFYWGEAPGFRKESPVLLLAAGLIDEHHRQGISVLDLGTSTEGSVPNAGLIAFKEGLGCQATAKRTYVLDPD